MVKMMKLSTLVICICILLGSNALAADKAGLIGIQYGSEDFTGAQNLVVLTSLDRTFTENDDYGRHWSGKWEGFLIAPVTGNVMFELETDQKATVEFKLPPSYFENTIKVTKAPEECEMVKGHKYPITISYVKKGDQHDCYLRVKWTWAKQSTVSIGSQYLSHSSETAQAFDAIVKAADDDDDNDDDGDDDDDDDDQGGSLVLEEILAQKDDSANASMPGLTGIICESSDWTRPASQDIIKHTNHNWTGGPGDWSGYWQGYLQAPATGEVTFIAEVDNGIKLAIGDTMIIEGLDSKASRTGKYTMVKGKKYPLRLWYFQDGDPSYLRVYWSWAGQEKVIIDENAFSYSPSDTKFSVSKLPGDYWGDDAPFYYDATGSEPLDLAYQDGRLNPVVGVQSYAVFRSNREHPKKYTGGMGKTYIHAPMICYWKGKYWLEFLAAPVNEHDANTETYMTSSADGKDWDVPKLLFPSFKPHDDEHLTICHQRMGFYVSKNDRLLIMAFYGKYPSPNEGDGVGRAVREVYEDGSVGPLYFIRFNRHAGYNETNTKPFPFYKTSPDKSFIAICDELMANKLMVQQWWEEDRSKDGFYMLSGEQ
ncbi:MAG: PA14 domain-containing protein, partial [Planctomycetota bacterium]